MAQVRIPAEGPPTPPGLWLNGQLALGLYRTSHDGEELRQLELIEPVPH